jgi:hypothetical protein
MACSKPVVERRFALRALLVGPKGQQQAIDRPAGRLSSVALETDSPPRLRVDRRAVRVAGI